MLSKATLWDFVNNGSTAPTVTFSSNSSFTTIVSNNVILDGNLTIEPFGGAHADWGGATVSGAGVTSGAGSLTNLSGDFIQITGANTFTGGFFNTNASVGIELGSTGLPGAITSSPFGTGTVTLTAGFVDANATGGANLTINNALVFNAGTTQFGQGSGFGGLTWGGATTLNGNLKLVDADGNGNGLPAGVGNALVFGGNIGDGGSGATLQLATSSSYAINQTVIFNGNNTYTGATTIAGGQGTGDGCNGNHPSHF